MTLMFFFLHSAALKFLVDVPHVWLIVNNLGIDLDPGMGLERNELGAEYHFCRVPVAPKEQCGCRGSLEAKHLLEIEDAGKIDSVVERVE
jgi:hypothetical protein